MGTSLSVAPVAHIPAMLRHIPSVMINAEPVMAHGVWDVLVQGACDEAIHSMRRQGLEDGILSPSTGDDGWGALSAGAPAAGGSEFAGLNAAAHHHAQPTPASLQISTPSYPRGAESGYGLPVHHVGTEQTGAPGGESTGERWWSLAGGGQGSGGAERVLGDGGSGGRALGKEGGKRARAPAESREVDELAGEYECGERQRLAKRGRGRERGSRGMSPSFAPAMAALKS